MHPKKYSKAIGAGIGVAISIIVIWLLSLVNIDVPADVKPAIEIVLTALITIAATYLAPANVQPPQKAKPREPFIK